MYKKYKEGKDILHTHKPKTSLMMRLIPVILITGLMQVHAAGFGQKISVSFSNAPLKSVFKELRKKSGYNFVYTDNLLKRSAPVNIHMRNADLNEILAGIFSSQSIQYVLKHRTVIIKEKKDGSAVLSGNKRKVILVSEYVQNSNGQPSMIVSDWIKQQNGVTIIGEKEDYVAPELNKKKGGPVIIVDGISTGYLSRDVK